MNTLSLAVPAPLCPSCLAPFDSVARLSLRQWRATKATSTHRILGKTRTAWPLCIVERDVRARRADGHLHAQEVAERRTKKKRKDLKECEKEEEEERRVICVLFSVAPPPPPSTATTTSAHPLRFKIFLPDQSVLVVRRFCIQPEAVHARFALRNVVFFAQWALHCARTSRHSY